MAQPNDYTAFREATEPQAGDLAKLVSLVRQLDQAEGDMIEAELEFKAKQKLVYSLSSHDIPTLMTDIGIKDFRLEDGRRVEVGSNIRCGGPGPEAIKWLLDHNQSALVKNTVTVSFNKGQEADAAALEEKLSGEKRDFKRSSSVHPQTMAAHIREQLKAGVNFPMELFGAYKSDYTKVTS